MLTRLDKKNEPKYVMGSHVHEYVMTQTTCLETLPFCLVTLTTIFVLYTATV